MLKTVAKEVLVPKAPVKEKVYRIKGLTEKEKEKERQLLRSACIGGEIESSEVWKEHRCGACIHCQMYKETREIGAYEHTTGEKEELLNEQSEHCIRYKHERTYHWNSWKRDREEERFGSEIKRFGLKKSWHRIE